MFAPWVEKAGWLAAGWTMIHFLWIGALVGLAVALGRRALRKAVPELRYTFVLVGLLAMTLAPAIIFVRQLSFAKSEQAQIVAPDSGPFGAQRGLPVAKTQLLVPSRPIEASAPRQVPFRGTETDGTYHWPTFLHTVATEIPWFWLVGTLVTLVGISFGLIGTVRLQQDCRIVKEGWVVEKAGEVRRMLRITRRVAIALTDKVGSPIVIGILQPVILLPVGLLTGYSPEQVKMLLIHELAHVRRRDGLINLGQRLVEAFLFFHPLVWVVSRWVREEREHCCDAVVVEQTGNADAYAATLALLANALRPSLPSSALAAARHPMVGRIRRILQADDHGQAVPGAGVLGIAGLILIGLLLPRLWGGAIGSEAQPTTTDQEGGGTATHSGKLAAANSGATASPTRTASAERTFEFPNDRVFGTIEVQDRWPERGPESYFDDVQARSWTLLGPAKGTVIIPAGKRVRLSISKGVSLQDLSPLSTRGPSSLEELRISGWEASERLIDETLIAHLRHLTGLESMTLEQVQVTPKGLADLVGLTSLKHLTLRVHSPPPGQSSGPKPFDDLCLKQLSRLASLESLVLASPEITDEGLIALGKLPRLRELDVWSEKVRGTGLAELAKGSQLRSLYLAGPQVDDSCLKALAELKSLRRLQVTYSQITDDGLCSLGGLSELEDLRLNCKSVSARGIGTLKSLGGLKRLEISSADRPVQPAAVDGIARELKEIQSLEHLRLDLMDMSDAGLDCIAKLAKLKTLHVLNVTYDTPGTAKVSYSDVGVKSLSQLSRLEALSLGSSLITDAGLTYVGSLTNLHWLRLDAPAVTGAGLASLAPLQKLEQLHLHVPRVTVSGLNSLNALTNLRFLAATGISQDKERLDLSRLIGLLELHLAMRQTFESGTVTSDDLKDADLAWLSGMKQLRVLEGIRGIGDAGMKYLSALTSLEVLNFSASRVTDAGLAYLSGLQNLHTLLYQGPITDQGLRQLEGLRRLEALSIPNLDTQVSPAALARFRQMHPDLRLIVSDTIGAGGG